MHLVGKVSFLIPTFVLGGYPEAKSNASDSPCDGSKSTCPFGTRKIHRARQYHLPLQFKTRAAFQQFQDIFSKIEEIFQPQGFSKAKLMNSCGDDRLPRTLGPTSCSFQARWGLTSARLKVISHDLPTKNLQTMDGFNWWKTERH